MLFPFQLCQDAVGLLLVGKLHLALGGAVELGGKGTAAARGQQLGIDGPVLLRNELADLLFPVADQADSHRLHPSGRETPAHLFPQERGQLIAHDPVKDTTGLLGVHQVNVDGAGVFHTIFHTALGDLIEGHTVLIVEIQPQDIGQMPGDGLAFPVRVGCQIDLVALFRLLLQRRDKLLLVLHFNVVRFEAVFDVHADLALGQVADVSHGRHHFIAGTEIFLDRFGLCGALHNHQI